MSETPVFPPLLSGHQVASGQDPFAKAIAQAAMGCDAGLIVWAPGPDLSAAVVFAPEEPLEQAITALFAVALGLGDALGALAPPEVAVHYVWPGGLKVNGADCGSLRVTAASTEAAATPDWLVIGVHMPFAPDSTDPGLMPDRTCLMQEGCGEITPLRLLESWSRHMLTWINRREGEGLAPLHAEWRSRAWGLGEDLAAGGTFVGLDERGGRLVKTGETTRLDPLTTCLE